MANTSQNVTKASSPPEEHSEGRLIVGCDLHSKRVVLQRIRYTNGTIEKLGSPIGTTVEQLYDTYRKQIPTDSLTVIEASTNSFAVADKLDNMGFKVKIVKSDTVSRCERSDHINDRIDAYNLARYEALGLAQEVYRPTKVDRMHRAMFIDYHKTSAKVTAISNEIWNFCHGNNITLPPPHVGHSSKLKFIEELLKTCDLDEYLKFSLQHFFEMYKSLYEHKKNLEKLIAVVVAKDKRMLDAMTLIGIGPIMAFALVSYIGDINRFKRSAKLVSYFGLNPVCNESGESRSPRRLSEHGNRYVKAMLVESVKHTIDVGDTAACKWARKKKRHKHPNVVACAFARKTITYLFHVLKDGSTPNRESENTYYYKLLKLAKLIGREYVEKAGFCRAHDFVWANIKPRAAELPHNKPEDCAPLDPPKRKPPAKKAVTAA